VIELSTTDRIGTFYPNPIHFRKGIDTEAEFSLYRPAILSPPGGRLWANTTLAARQFDINGKVLATNWEFTVVPLQNVTQRDKTVVVDNSVVVWDISPHDTATVNFHLSDPPCGANPVVTVFIQNETNDLGSPASVDIDTSITLDGSFDIKVLGFEDDLPEQAHFYLVPQNPDYRSAEVVVTIAKSQDTA